MAGDTLGHILKFLDMSEILVFSLTSRAVHRRVHREDAPAKVLVNRLRASTKLAHERRITRYRTQTPVGLLRRYIKRRVPVYDYGELEINHNGAQRLLKRIRKQCTCGHLNFRVVTIHHRPCAHRLAKYGCAVPIGNPHPSTTPRICTLTDTEAEKAGCVCNYRWI